MKRYCEQVIGNIYDRGNVKEVSGSNMDIDCYGHEIVNGFMSHFMYGEEILPHVEEHGSIRGYDGPMFADAFVWDIDHSDIQQAHNDTLELLERLETIAGDLDHVRVWFSGSKGFHVALMSKELELLGKSIKIPAIVKYVCKDVAEGIESIDESIYDRTRIFRIANSKHPKTGLYKIPLRTDDIKTMDIADIKIMAEKPRELMWLAGESTSQYINYAIDAAVNNTVIETERKTSKMGVLEGLYNGFPSGMGNTGLTSVAGMLHAKNFSNDFVRGILHNINQGWEVPMSESALDLIVESVGRYSIDDEFVEIDDDDIMTMEQAKAKWEYIKQNRQYLDTGFPELDEQLTNFDPGKVLMIAARGGVGKTAVGMQIGNSMAKAQGGYNLFVSLEMPASAIYYRAAQIENNKIGRYETSKEFSEKLLTDKEAQSRALTQWSNTLVVDKSSLTMEKIEQVFNKAQEKYHGNVKNLLIDYVGLIDGTNDYQGMSKVAKDMKHLAKKLNTRIILLVQVSRKGGDGTIPVSLDMLRDSGSLEEAADMVLGMWLSPANQYRIHNRFIKNRDGERGASFDFIQTGLSYKSCAFDDSEDQAVANEQMQTKGKW